MRNPETYLELMSKSMTVDAEGKLFFVSRINWKKYDVVVDFGCAAMEMLADLDDMLEEFPLTLIGVDKVSFRPLSKEMNEFKHPAEFHNDLYTIPYDRLRGKKVLVVFSSVLHELGDDANALNRVMLWCKRYAQTVVCRDMYFLPKYFGRAGAMTYRLNEKKEMRLFDQLLSVSDETEKTCTIKSYGRKLREIFDNYSKEGYEISTTALLYEFFLKYTYDINWDTEVKEMYFCNNAVKLMQRLQAADFEESYYRTFTLTYKKQQVKKRFKYKMKLPTHIMYILEAPSLGGNQ